MATLTIDNKQYDMETISSEAKAKLESARFCEQKIEQLEAELAIARTARAAYLQALPPLLSDNSLLPGKKAVKKTKPKTKTPSKH